MPARAASAPARRGVRLRPEEAWALLQGRRRPDLGGCWQQQAEAVHPVDGPAFASWQRQGAEAWPAAGPPDDHIIWDGVDASSCSLSTLASVWAICMNVELRSSGEQDEPQGRIEEGASLPTAAKLREPMQEAAGTPVQVCAAGPAGGPRRRGLGRYAGREPHAAGRQLQGHGPRVLHGN